MTVQTNLKTQSIPEEELIEMEKVLGAQNLKKSDIKTSFVSGVFLGVLAQIPSTLPVTNLQNRSVRPISLSDAEVILCKHHHRKHKNHEVGPGFFTFMLGGVLAIIGGVLSPIGGAGVGLAAAGIGLMFEGAAISGEASLNNKK